MESERSNQVIDRYKQHKLNVSVMTRIRHLLTKFEADDEADRRWAWIGVVVLIGLAIVALYYFINGSKIMIS